MNGQILSYISAKCQIYILQIKQNYSREGTIESLQTGKQADKMISDFIESFNSKGEPLDGFKYTKNVGEACRFCPFKESGLCDQIN